MVEKKQKRLLFLSWFFPPQNSIAAVRTGNMVRELLKHGWEITVVTATPGQFIKPQNGMAMINRPDLHYIFVDGSHDPCQQNILHLGGIWQLNYYLTALCRRFLISIGQGERGILRAILKATAALKGDSFDLILSSGSPFLQFKAAALLAKRLNCPYVLDYRDPWSQNQHLKNLTAKSILLERELLDGAKMVLAATPTLARMLQTLSQKPVQVLSNGFSKITGEPAAHRFSAPTLVFAGNLYPPQITLAPVFAAFALIKDKTDFRLYYCGRYADEALREARRYGVESMLDTDQNLPRDVALQKIKGATLALAVSSTGQIAANKHDQCIIPAKIYEAISLKVPVLLIAPDDNDAVRLIVETGAGFHFAGTDITGLAQFLISGKFAITPTARINEYSWDRLGERLDQILSGLLP